MTITEDLRFSVLSAPLAAVDRRSLSQAWYSALYAKTSAAPPAPQRAAAPVQRRAVPCARRTSAAQSAGARHTAGPHAREARESLRDVRSGADVERRAPRSALARKIERAFLHPKAAPRKAVFLLEGGNGRVQIVLHSSGSQFKLVAICSPNARAHVAAALAQARYALALRGIELTAETRERVSC